MQEQQSPTQPPDMFVAFAEPASQQWIDCCVHRFSTRVSEHFQISDAGFSVRQVTTDQIESEMANLRQLVVVSFPLLFRPLLGRGC